MDNKHPNDNICCKCVKIDPVCYLNQKEYKIGEIWNDGPCRTFKCVIKDGQPMVTTSRVECPTITCKPNETLVTLPSKCCSQCVPKNITTTVRKFNILFQITSWFYYMIVNDLFWELNLAVDRLSKGVVSNCLLVQLRLPWVDQMDFCKITRWSNI